MKVTKVNFKNWTSYKYPLIFRGLPKACFWSLRRCSHCTDTQRVKPCNIPGSPERRKDRYLLALTTSTTTSVINKCWRRRWGWCTFWVWSKLRETVKGRINSSTSKRWTMWLRRLTIGIASWLCRSKALFIMTMTSLKLGIAPVSLKVSTSSYKRNKSMSSLCNKMTRTRQHRLI